jgi:hypothetical protein
VELPANAVSLTKPAEDFAIQVCARMEPEMMHVIPGGNVLDLRKAGIFQPAREHDVTCDAISPQTHCRETHAHLKCDARFFRHHANWATSLYQLCEVAE